MMENSHRGMSPSKMSNFEVDQGIRKPALIHSITYRNIGNLFLVITLLCFSTFYFGYCLTFISTVSKSTLVYYFG